MRPIEKHVSLAKSLEKHVSLVKTLEKHVSLVMETCNKKLN